MCIRDRAVAAAVLCAGSEIESSAYMWRMYCVSDWIDMVPGNPLRVECRYCDVKLNASVWEVKSHAKTSKHARNAARHSSTAVKRGQLKNWAADEETKISYLLLALWFCIILQSRVAPEVPWKHGWQKLQEVARQPSHLAAVGCSYLWLAQLSSVTPLKHNRLM